MNNFTFIFIIVTIIGFFVFWKTAKFILKILIKYAPKVDSSEKYIGAKVNNPASLDGIIKILELERIRLYEKTKGLFRRAFLRTWFILTLFMYGLSYLLGEGPEEPSPDAIIVPVLFSFFVALIFSGIYTLVKKGINYSKFSQLFKKELVNKIVKHVNADLNFIDKGISKDDFDSADLFRGINLRSEDCIEGTINGQKLRFSECTKYSQSNSNKSSTTYFRGLFIELELNNTYISSPIKFIPKTDSITVLGVKVNALATKLRVLKPEHRIAIPEDKKYEIYSEAGEEIKKVLTRQMLKIVEFIFEKYEYKNVVVSLNKNKLYVAINWNQDMFETSAFLSKSIVESGLAKQVYQDILFVNQILEEVSMAAKDKVEA